MFFCDICQHCVDTSTMLSIITKQSLQSTIWKIDAKIMSIFVNNKYDSRETMVDGMELKWNNNMK